MKTRKKPAPLPVVALHFRDRWGGSKITFHRSTNEAALDALHFYRFEDEEHARVAALIHGNKVEEALRYITNTGDSEGHEFTIAEFKEYTEAPTRGGS